MSGWIQATMQQNTIATPIELAYNCAAPGAFSKNQRALQQCQFGYAFYSFVGQTNKTLAIFNAHFEYKDNSENWA